MLGAPRGGRCAATRGAAGIDGVTLAEVERYGVDRLLDELAAELREGSYRVQPSRRVWIPKPGRTERRPLSIPAVREPHRAGGAEARGGAGLRGRFPAV